MTASRKLAGLGLTLPKTPEPVGAYLPAVRTGNLVFTSGQLPLSHGELIAKGKAGRDVSVTEAQAAARQCVLNALSAVVSLCGSLEKIHRIVRVNCFVNSAAGFTDQAKVANGASELLQELFGESGRHTRCALGAAELPLDSPVEIDIIAECE